jgi:hypothetical protein
MKSQDVVVLLKLISLEQNADSSADPEGDSRHQDMYSARALESALGISKTEVNASINRSVSSGLAIKDNVSGQAKANRQSLYNFIVHGLKFAFPAKVGAMTRGIPTAFAAAPLKGRLISAGEYIYVWPYAKGKDKGQSVKPLFGSVPEATRKDERLYEYLALIDAIRLGNQRETGLATDRLSEKLLKKWPA